MFESYVILYMTKTHTGTGTREYQFESYVILYMTKTQCKEHLNVKLFESYVILYMTKTFSPLFHAPRYV